MARANDGERLPDLSQADWLSRPATQAVFAALTAHGAEARAVGGAVRNALMGTPVKDVDIATTALPADVMRLATQAGLHAVPTGFEHGTVTVVAQHVPFEVTTLRRDIETFGRHARVTFTTDWTEDARRRDFTMNALYCSADGTVHDPLDGYADVLARRVRFIGDARERIREDFLRTLRFFRFVAEYGNGAPPDPEGLAAAIAEKAGLSGLSGERIRAELLLLLAVPVRSKRSGPCAKPACSSLCSARQATWKRCGGSPPSSSALGRAARSRLAACGLDARRAAGSRSAAAAPAPVGRRDGAAARTRAPKTPPSIRRWASPRRRPSSTAMGLRPSSTAP